MSLAWGLAWTYDIPYAPGSFQVHQEATPLVFNNVLYSITPWSIVYAVNLKTHEELWHSNPQVNQQVWQSRICCGVVNRGLALYQGMVIAPAVDGRLRALDAVTGKLIWETRVSPETQAYSITMAPRVIKGGKVIVGVSGGEYGIRGFFSAFDAMTGKLAWKFYTVPGDPSKPFEQPELQDAAKTWTKEWWKIGGGGAVWNGIAYDDDTDTVYVGTGQPGPWTSYSRGSGDNLFTDCILAVKGSTGKLLWYYQTVPGDDWDYDNIADLMLLDLSIGGRMRKVIIQSPKDGFFYVLDRQTGELISADPITKISWNTGIDMKTGRPNVNPEAHYETMAVRVLPGPSGGHVWTPWSYSPATGLVYIPGTAGGSYTYQADPNFVPQSTEIGPSGRGRMNMGTAGGGGGGGGGRGRGAAGGGAGGTAAANAPATGAGGNAPVAAGNAPNPGRGNDALPGAVAAATGPVNAGGAPAPPKDMATFGPDGPTGNVLYAWDPIAKKERWRAAGAAAGPFAGGSLATAGNLVFTSVNDRLMAFLADTGEKLLDLNLHTSQLGPPISFTIDGKQYISVAGAQAGATQNNPHPAHLLVLAVDGNAAIPGAPAN